MEVAIVGEKMMPMEEVAPAYLDRGLFFGDGVYEVVRSYDGRLFALDDHLERLANSLEAVEIRGVDIEWVRQQVIRAFEQAQIPDAKIYFHITRGSGPRSHLPQADSKPNFLLTVTQVDNDPRAKAEGIAVCTVADVRWKRCDIKSLNLLPNVLGKMEAAKRGCEEAIFVDESGLITEGTSSSFFAVMGGRLRTAPLTANILPSITRKYVLKAAAELGLEVAEESVAVGDAVGAEELFIAVTTKDIVPVVRFDDALIGQGRPGAITTSLAEVFRRFT